MLSFATILYVMYNYCTYPQLYSSRHIKVFTFLVHNIAFMYLITAVNKNAVCANISNIIKILPISGQSTPVVKGCMSIMSVMVDTAKNIDRLLISSGSFQGKIK